MASGTNAQNPNIVFIHAESMDGRMMGCMGHPALRNATPNLDRLAERGVLFTNAYTNCPVCNPSRASMWSGKYPNHYDCWNNHEGLRDGVPTFQTTFDSAGYRTAAIGPLDYSYGKHSIRDRVGSWTRSACIRRPISRTPMPQVAENGTLNGGDWNRTYESMGFIRDAAAAKVPLMLYLTTGLVHPAFTAEPRAMARIDEKEIDIPPGLGPVDGSGHPVMDYIRITKNCDHPFSEDLVHQIRYIYFAMIAALDDMVGRVLQTLDDLGLSDSTYVVFSSDHGEMAGEHNQILKRTMYESSVHVPLIIRGPGVRQGHTVDAPVALIDLYPTLMDMARIDYADHAHNPGYPETIDGESLMPQLVGTAERVRDWAFSEYHGDRCCTGAYMLRQGRWKYVKYIGYEPQLFDLVDDPGEMVDLAAQRPEAVAELDGILEGRFDCDGIDARAKRYDRESFRPWRENQKAAGTYEDTMAMVYSGFDRLCIEDIVPWRRADEDLIEAWLEA
ncbi:MAG: sulfatase-like hydrolase/transferase [Candidatus Latescibacteria bacterium]|jgi:arylsulfatase K|nr:sulfatase-like hydrolase/transferase [Candidatus Latescibacterota bacterium]